MTRRLRPGGAALLALALTTGLSACGGGSGFDAATRLIEPDNASGETRTETVLARAIVLVKSANAPAAALAGTIINRGDKADTLDSILIEPARGAQPLTLKPNLALNPGQVLALGTEAAAPLTIADGGALKVGHFALVTMRFRTSGDIKMEVPVEVRDGYYSSIVPATGQTATQAERKLANACVTNAKSSTAKADPACTDAARAAARAAAAKVQGGASITTTDGSGAATSKAGSASVPTAKKPTATRSKPAATTTKPAAPAPAPAAPAAGAGHDTGGHAPDAH